MVPALLGAGAPLEQTLPPLREAAAAAQQEARFAVLALSSASGNAPFDAALRRYVEFLTADGALQAEYVAGSSAMAGAAPVARTRSAAAEGTRARRAARRATAGVQCCRVIPLLLCRWRGHCPAGHGEGWP